MDEQGRIRIAVVGAGIYGVHHLDAYRANPDSVLCAVCDRSEEARRRVEEKYHVPVYAELEDLLETEEVDAVSVATPDPYHAQPVLTAIRHGKDVLVEKPLATSAADAEAIRGAAEKAGVRVMVDYHKRWDPASTAVYSKLREQDAGKPVRGYMCMDNVYDVPLNWLKWSSHSSPVHFVGTHCYDLIRWYMGCEAAEVYAVGHKGILQAKGVDAYDSVTALLTMENGCTWTVENAWILPDGFAKADDGRTEILCENVMIRVDSQHRGVEFFDDRKQYTPNVCFVQDFGGRPTGFCIDPLNDFVRCLKTGKKFRANLEDGVQAERIAEAVLRSADTHQIVRLGKGGGR